MRNFRLYLIVGLMTFGIGVIAGRFLISSQVKENCSENITMTIMNEKSREFPKVILKTPNFVITFMDVKDGELSRMMPKTSDGKSLFPCQIIIKSSL